MVEQQKVHRVVSMVSSLSFMCLRVNANLTTAFTDRTVPAASTQLSQDISASDGPPKDVTMIDIDEPSKAPHEQHSRNVDQFFNEPFV